MPRHISDEEAEELISRTEEIESSKEAKKAEREQRKLEREQRKRQVFMEKLVAPVFLLLTILLSLGLLLMRR